MDRRCIERSGSRVVPIRMFAAPSTFFTALPIFRHRLRHLLSTLPTYAQTYEFMIWLGVYGGISPLSDKGYPLKPVHIPIVSGVPFNLIKGRNGNVIVYSFVAKNNTVTSYNGDLVPFCPYLQANRTLSGGQYFQTLQAGTEVFKGNGVKMVTTLVEQRVLIEIA
ncbi:MAG: hypothetical protein LQ337_002491 [Flavoplaca oasis]|nr:MAG: hypothetical protein LQ337_002491 [Flavoplaca oasis]